LNDSGELTAFSSVLFKQIETDITLEHNGTIYREYKALESAAKPSSKEETLHREFAISKLYQDYMEHVLYGDIDWKKFLNRLHKKYRHGVWVVHNVLASPESLLIEAIHDNTLEGTFEKA